MLKLAPHLDPNIFTASIKQAPTRDGLGSGLVEAGKRDPRVVALSADLTESTRVLPFAEAFPKRFVQCGIAEQNMASVASGMAAMGKIPFMSSYAMFSPGRNWEQIRTTIAYNDQNVKVIGAHAGVSVGPDGATHQAIEDIALMRIVPNMSVVVPCDSVEAEKVTLYAAEHVGPLYLRFGREKSPIITTDASPFRFGKAEVFAERDPAHTRTVGIIATGILTYQALKAAHELDQEGIGVSVLHLGTIKPIDREALVAFAQNHEFLVTLEEHQVAGGMGSAVAEVLSTEYPTRIIMCGVHDRFGQSGEPTELIAHYGMDAQSIVERVHEVFAVGT